MYPVLRTEIIEHIEPPTLALESIPSKVEVPIHEDLEELAAEPSPIALILSAILIVEESSL